jgi:AmmeMemoRadiSam system protein A
VLTLKEVGPSLPRLAREAIEAWLGSQPLSLADRDTPAAPVFVSLHQKTGELRGCMGTLVATEEDVRKETARCAVLSASRDPRFTPLTRSELERVDIDVTVLCPLEVIQGPESLDPKRYGVVVSDAHGRRGVLLPDLEGIEDVQTQLSIAKRKAGIAQGAPFALQRFEALRFNE